MKSLIVACVSVVMSCTNLRAEDAVRAGRFLVEPPTLICLGFEWEIAGDDNHNIRVMRNRGLNAAHAGLSAQPVFGGPAYYVRNVVYNTPVALKFNSKPAGLSSLFALKRAARGPPSPDRPK
jgi:hypothetical protein